ncbi:Arylesterase precursor [hydrothermal vent metagenome]|uniref:Arylesterase n=1 Tax=hydrothermal vent metagenome TaxID=652676 RepID=A0A3B0VF09_9ZZZZ
MRSLFIILILIIFAGCTAPEIDTGTETATGNTTMAIKANSINFTILALGDSLTEGLGVAEMDSYPALLQKSLANNIKVINAGLSGETSAGLKNRLNWVLKQKPDLTILNIGANDAMRGLPLDLTKNNIDEIITRIKAANSDVILAGMQIYANLGKEYVHNFNAIYPKLAVKHNIPLIPFFLEHIAGKAEFNQNDLLHPNAKGYQVIVELNVLPIVNQYLNNKQHLAFEQ